MPFKVQRAMEELEFLIEPPYDNISNIRKKIFRVMDKVQCCEKTAWNAWKQLKTRWKKNAEEYRIINELITALHFLFPLLEEISIKPRPFTANEIKQMNFIKKMVNETEG